MKREKLYANESLINEHNMMVALDLLIKLTMVNKSFCKHKGKMMKRREDDARNERLSNLLFNCSITSEDEAGKRRQNV